MRDLRSEPQTSDTGGGMAPLGSDDFIVEELLPFQRLSDDQGAEVLAHLR